MHSPILAMAITNFSLTTSRPLSHPPGTILAIMNSMPLILYAMQQSCFVYQLEQIDERPGVRVNELGQFVFQTFKACSQNLDFRLASAPKDSGHQILQQAHQCRGFIQLEPATGLLSISPAWVMRTSSQLQPCLTLRTRRFKACY